MNNWSTDTTQFKKNYPDEFQQWQILQQINYGLDDEKISESLLRKYWQKIKDQIISNDIKNYLELILWPEDQS